MDYAKSGAAKGPKNAPRFDASSKHGHGAPTPQKPGLNADKAAFLARLKANAEAKKKD
jgi:hypothetical protein